MRNEIEIQLSKLVSNNDEIEISNGKTIAFREYLGGAMEAFELKSCDYYTAYFILRKIAEGKNADEIGKQIKDFWESMEQKYGV